MLGDRIAELTTTETGRRVLATVGGLHPALEVSMTGTGHLLGTHVREFITYGSELRPDGSLFGEGQGVGMSATGEAYSWHGSGIGHFTGGGTVSWRGTIYFESAADAFLHLNDLIGVFEFDSDSRGAGTVALYEWK
ncbi:hypothetical protein ACIPLC_20610 [Kitasatospora sp. NPDC086801]|uniref:hypothetical protein n=1 Tax=Kitasatospora sp. NPDC086801 TaxID=3364066 RepID=UPI003817D2F2